MTRSYNVQNLLDDLKVLYRDAGTKAQGWTFILTDNEIKDEGFLEPMSRSMSYQVRAWIAYLIESKWEGKELSINNDEQLKSIVEVEETRYNENAEIEQHYKYR